MFKLVKYSNALNNYPEIIEFPCDLDCEYFNGCVYNINNGMVSVNQVTDNDPKFIAIETIVPYTKDTIKGYFPQEGMIFETTATEGISQSNVGGTYNFIVYSTGGGGMSGTSGSDVLLLDYHTYEKNRKVLVALKW